MTMKKIIFAFVAIICIPLLPVCVLYAFFGNQNYFGLEGWSKGLLASGPIASYLYCLHFGFRMFRNLLEIGHSYSEGPPGHCSGHGT